MQQSTHVVGIDPGLVHTGVVEINLYPATREVFVYHEAIVGPDTKATEDWIYRVPSPRRAAPLVFVEGYKPRSNLGTDTRMVSAVQDMRRALPSATVLLNTGVKKVVKRPLMELLGVWSFSTVTHHQDLRSAARIALLGMLKQEHLNRLLADVVHDHLHGETWDVHH